MTGLFKGVALRLALALSIILGLLAPAGPSFAGSPATRSVVLGQKAWAPLYLPRIVAVGDSITAQNHGVLSAGLQIYQNAHGEMAVAQALYPAFRFDTWVDTVTNTDNNFWGANQGLFGNRPEDVLARLPTILNLKPDIVELSIGVNGLNLGVQYQADKITAIIAGLRAARPKMPIIVTNVRPTTFAKSSSGYPKATILALNALIAQMHNPANGVWVVDLYAAYDQGDGYAATADTEDGLHPSAAGAIKGARALLPTIREVVRYGNIMDGLPGTSLIAGRSNFQGTAGFKNGGVTGTVASLMQANQSATYASVVASLEANAETGGSSQVFTLTPTGTTAASSSIDFATSANIASGSLAGNWVQLAAEIEYDGRTIWSLPQVYAAVASTASGTSITYGGPSGGAATVYTSSAGRMWAITPRMLLPADATTVSGTMKLYWVPDGTTTPAVVKVRRWVLQTVPSPIPDYQ